MPCLFPQNLNPDGTGMTERDTKVLKYYRASKKELLKVPFEEESWKYGPRRNNSMMSMEKNIDEYRMQKSRSTVVKKKSFSSMVKHDDQNISEPKLGKSIFTVTN